MLFGWGRVPRWLQVFAAIAVAVGTAISTFWILAANSWMQTPAGHEIRDGIVYPLDWWAIIFNPSFPYRLAHMLNAAYLTTGFVVLAVGARYLLAGRHRAQARTMVRMALCLLAVLAPLQLLIGDQHGLNTLKYQPTKVAAMEAHWDSNGPGDFHIFAWPDEQGRNEPIRDLDPAGRLADPDPQAQRPICRLEGRAAAGPAAGQDRVLRFPHHARRRLLHDRSGADRCLAVVVGRLVRSAMVSAHRRQYAGGSVSSRCGPAGSSPKAAASRGSCRASVAPPIRSRRYRRRPWRQRLRCS